MAIFFKDPNAYHIVAQNLCKYLPSNQIKALSTIAFEWKYVTDSILEKECLVKIHKNNVNELQLLSRRYFEFELQGISSEELNVFLRHIIKRYSEDEKNGKYKRYLKKLVLIEVDITSENMKLLKELEVVDKLYLSRCNMHFESFENQDMNICLKYLLFTVNSANDIEICRNLLSSNRESLECIALSGPAALQVLDPFHYPKLEKIVFNNATVNFEEFFQTNQQIRRCEFELMHLPRGTLQMLQKHCPFLDELCIKSCRTLEESESVNIDCATKLKVLTICGSMKFNLPDTKLENLNTFENNSGSPEFLTSLLPTMPELVNLSLQRSQRTISGFDFSSQLLSVISKNCPKLEKLNLRQVPDLSKNCSLYEFKKFEKLVILNLAYTKLSDELLFKLSIPKLRFVNIKGTCITDKGLEYLAINCPFLKDVFIGENANVTDEGVSYLVDKLKNLTYLGAERSSKLTQISVHTVASKKLLSADLSGVRAELKDIEKYNLTHEIKRDLIFLTNEFRTIVIST